MDEEYEEFGERKNPGLHDDWSERLDAIDPNIKERREKLKQLILEARESK